MVELDEEAARATIRGLAADGVEAFAIALLWSTASNVHERALARIVAEEAPAAFVSVSSGVVSRVGEYQRTVATLINAMIGPVTSDNELLYGQGSGYPHAGFVITAIRVSARARMTSHRLASAGAGQPFDVAPSCHRDVVWYELDATPRRTAVYDGSGLRPGARITGPAVVEFVDTTLVLRHAQTATMDPWSSIVIEAGGSAWLTRASRGDVYDFY